MIALSVATPAMAASLGQLTLTFGQSTYRGVGGNEFTDITVLATRGGATAAAGLSLTVTLTGGYTFDGAATTHFGSTGDSGTLSVPRVNIPLGGGTSAITVTDGTATATLTAVASSIAKARWNDDAIASFPAVSAGSQAVGANFFLDPNNNLSLSDGRNIDNNVEKAVGAFLSSGHLVTYTTNGVARNCWVDSSGNASWGTWSDVPLNSEPIEGNYFLAPNGDLYRENSLVSSRVTSAAGTFNGQVGNLVTYVHDNKSWTYWPGNGNWVTYAAVPEGTSAVAGGFFLTPSGELYYQATKIADGVTAADGTMIYDWTSDGGGRPVTYVDATGGHQYWTGPRGGYASYPDVPAGSTPPREGSVFLTPDRRLFHDNSTIATNVLTAAASYGETAGILINWTEAQ
ncbi:hypothetical protein O159_10940 [Leifsonia xyli subsp. cynodontis DSM 46306]|uniref:Uncharacterized protein n=1 Tax=Leifsonia xyli subsp. cynodontis DSM 46306 TaxID=1389489 RepID=U3P5X2_LEIXC|nr:hypothetical protein [Leifsonia xyli]AGW41196.1 hypothetical protein O159_10940 [Leifsonia xyli subsp. cynodontis DSM 46306]